MKNRSTHTAHGVLPLYTDGPIGMDHPLFMAKMQAGIDARMAVDSGMPLSAAILGITARMRDLFGDVPAAMIAAQVSIAYATAAADGAQA